MPQIPTGNTAPDIRPNLQARALPSVEDLGGGSGSTVALGNKLGSDIGDVAIRAAREANQIAVTDKDRQAAAISSSLLNDPQSGALNQRGQKAFSAYGSSMQTFDKSMSDLAAGLTTDEQKAAFSARVSQRRQELNDRLQIHVAQERKVWDDQVTLSSVDNETDAVLAAAGDPGYKNATSLGEQRIVENLWLWGDRNGQLSPPDDKGIRLPSPELDKKIREAKSKMYVGVVTTLLAKDKDQEARAFYDDHKKDVSGEQTKHVLDALEEGTLRGESQRKADAFIATSKDEETARLKLASIKDPKLKDETERRIDEHYQRQRVAEKNADESLYLGSRQLTETSPGKNPLDAIPPSVSIKLSGDDKRAIVAMVRPPKATDPAAWLAFSGALTAGRLADVSQADYERDYKSRFNQEDRSRADDIFASAKQGSKDNAKLSSTISAQQRIKDSLIKAELIPGVGKPNSAQAVLHASFETVASKAIQDYEQTELQGKRHASGNEQQTIIDGLLAQRVFVHNRIFPDKEAVASLVTSEDSDKTYVPLAKIPPNRASVITNQIAAYGRPADKDTIQRAYAAYVMGDRAGYQAIISGKK